MTHWSDTSITTYVLGSTALGEATLTVDGLGDAADAVVLQILPLEPASGRIAWRFKADASFIPQRQAAGPDGSIYAQDALGRLYALSEDGLLQWIFDVGGQPEGPVAVGTDGTIYVAANPAGPDVRIVAINADGTERWTFTDPGVTQGIIAGPSIGPDGNLYAVSEAPGLGALSLTPDGDLRWSNQGDPIVFESGQLGLEIGFSEELGRMYVAFDQIGVGGGPRLFSFDMESGDQEFSVPSAFLGVTFTDPPYPTVGPDGKVYMNTGNALRAFDPESGSIVWTAFPFTNGVLKPTIGGDGRIYTVRALFTMTAVNPSGSIAWSVVDSGILFAPVVSPDDATIVAGGRINFGQPGFIKAFTTGGTTLWQEPLPLENGSNIIPSTRATWSADSTTAYIGTSLASQGPVNPFCYLYAVRGVDLPSSPYQPVAKVIRAANEQIGESLRRRNSPVSLRILLRCDSLIFADLLVLALEALSPQAAMTSTAMGWSMAPTLEWCSQHGGRARRAPGAPPTSTTTASWTAQTSASCWEHGVRWSECVRERHENRRKKSSSLTTPCASAYGRNLVRNRRSSSTCM